MSSSALSVKKYREHGKSLRSVARDTADPVIGHLLRTIARDYERLANTIELLAGKQEQQRSLAGVDLNVLRSPSPGIVGVLVVGSVCR